MPQFPVDFRFKEWARKEGGAQRVLANVGVECCSKSPVWAKGWAQGQWLRLVGRGSGPHLRFVTSQSGGTRPRKERSVLLLRGEFEIRSPQRVKERKMSKCRKHKRGIKTRSLGLQSSSRGGPHASESRLDLPTDSCMRGSGRQGCY